MIWTLQSFLGQFFDAMVGQVVSVLGGGSRPTSWSSPRGDTPRDNSAGAAPSPPLPAREPARGATAPAERAASLDQELGGDATKLVSYTIVSLRRCHERILPGGSGEVLVTISMTSETFAAWIVACYLQAEDQPEERRAEVARQRRNAISHEEKKYLRVFYEVLSRWPSEPNDCCENRKLDALEGIRDALLNLPRKPIHGVAAWESAVQSPAPKPNEEEKAFLQALRELGGEAATRQLVDKTGLPKNQVNRARKSLESAGRIRSIGVGIQTRYQLVEQEG